MITFDHVSKVYDLRGQASGAGRVVALDDVSLSVEKGQIFGILGRSGAGKTTLFRCLNQLEPVTLGTITVDGVDWTSLKGAQLRAERRRMGTIFQHFNLLASRTVYDNVAFGLELAGEKQAIAPRVPELLELVGLPDKAKAFPSQLSGGQKQRVGIARALATHPSVLLMDEATSALDPVVRDEILTIFADFTRDEEHAVLLSSHIVSDLEKICDYIAFLHKGKLVLCEEKDRLL